MYTKIEAAKYIKSIRPELNMIQILMLLTQYQNRKVALGMEKEFILKAMKATGHTEEEVISIMNS